MLNSRGLRRIQLLHSEFSIQHYLRYALAALFHPRLLGPRPSDRPCALCRVSRRGAKSGFAGGGLNRDLRTAGWGIAGLLYPGVSSGPAERAAAWVVRAFVWNGRLF